MSGSQGFARPAVVNYVAGADYRELIRLLGGSGYSVLELPGRYVRDRDSFLQVASEHLLKGAAAHNWSSFADELRSAVWHLQEGHVALVWTEAHQMLDGALADLITAADVLTGLSRELYKHDKVFVTFLLGEGPNFPPLDLNP